MFDLIQWENRMLCNTQRFGNRGLQRWLRRRTAAQGLAQPARIALACVSCLTDTEIAREVAVSPG